MASAVLTLAGLIIVIAISFAIWRDCWAENILPKPPGPKGLPFLGNVHQLPIEGQEVVFSEWAKKYGDVVYAKFFGTPAVILSSMKAVEDLLTKRSGTYSDRPPFIAMREVAGCNNMLPLIRYDTNYRKQRIWFHNLVSSNKAVKGFQPMQRRETYVALMSFVEDPSRFEAHFSRFGAAALLDVAYGHKVTTDDDALVRLAETAIGETARLGGGVGLILDFFPILKYWPEWMPGSGWKRNAKMTRAKLDRIRDEPYQTVLSNIERGKASASFLSDLLESCRQQGPISAEEEFDVKNAAATVYSAGTDTMSAVLSTFILAMVKHPTVLKKAQEEIDRVIGQERLPDFEDRESLPYINAVLSEVYRWHPPFVLGLPHKSSQDDVYRRYHIPSGSIILVNMWHISQNDERYPEPHVFRPERFLEKDILDPLDFIFGFGRRICPGKSLADASVFLLIANIVATMNISKAKDKDGNEIDPPFEFCQGVTSHPKAYECRIAPRSSKAVKLIQVMHEMTRVG